MMVPRRSLIYVSLLVLMLALAEAWPKPDEAEDYADDEAEDDAEDEAEDIGSEDVALSGYLYVRFRVLPLVEPAVRQQEVEVLKPITKAYDPDGLPSSFSAADEGWLTPVKNQGIKCGAGPAFAATAVIEVCFARITGQTVSYSEEQFVDCAETYERDNGCLGANPIAYFFWTLDTNSVLYRESDYPYATDSLRQPCIAKDPTFQLPVAIVNDTYHTITGTEEELKVAVALYGAASANLVMTTATAKKMVTYRGGIFHCTDEDLFQPDEELGLSMAVVGYGSENGEKYWLLKNSWGHTYGENGYLRLARGRGDCGIGRHFSTVDCGLISELCPDQSCLKDPVRNRNLADEAGDEV